MPFLSTNSQKERQESLREKIRWHSKRILRQTFCSPAKHTMGALKDALGRIGVTAKLRYQDSTLENSQIVILELPNLTLTARHRVYSAACAMTDDSCPHQDHFLLSSLTPLEQEGGRKQPGKGLAPISALLNPATRKRVQRLAIPCHNYSMLDDCLADASSLSASKISLLKLQAQYYSL